MERYTLVLIDGDEIFYRYYSAHEEEQPIYEAIVDPWLYEGDVCLMSNTKAASTAALAAIESIASDYDNYIVCFTSTPNFRHEVYPEYKGGRLKTRKPIGYWTGVRQYCEGNEHAKKIEGLEADDVMSIIATNPKYRKRYDMTIWSQDKDMLQVPEIVVIRGGVETYVTEVEANLFRYTQALAGDTTDGYGGLRGYGPVKATKYLEPHRLSDEEVLIDAVISAYVKAGETVEYAYSQINCACILRFSEYDFKERQPKLKGTK